MSLLAFDPERLGWLHEAMHRAVADLDAIHVCDPLAGTERQRIRRAREAIAETWIPLVQRILRCPALSDAAPAMPELTIGTIGVVALVELGWTAASDPLDPNVPAIPSTAEMELLARLFASFEIADLLTTAAAVGALVARLVTILCTPGAASTLRGAPGWDEAKAIGTLADLRWTAARDLAADPDGPEATELREKVDELDRAIGAITTLASAHRTPDDRAAWLGAIVTDLDPYAAALVVRAMRPTGDELGDVVAIVLGRWVDPDPVTGDWVDRAAGDGSAAGPTTGDLLLPLVAGDEMASRRLARAAAADPRLLFETIDDASVVVDILSTATDPMSTSPWAAGSILRPILEWLVGEEVWRHDGMTGDFAARLALAEVSVPWLLQFHSLAGEWAWTTEEGDRMLAFLLDDREALDVLLATSGRWLDAAEWAPVRPDGTIDIVQVDAVAATLDQLCRTIAVDEVDDARFARWVTDHVVGYATTLVTSLVAAVPAIGEGAASVSPFLIDGMVDWLTEHGVLPPDGATATARADDRYDERMLRTATIAVSATVASLVDAGALPPSAMDELGDALDADDGANECDARDLHHRLLDYVESMRGRCAPETFDALGTVVQTFLAGNYANGVCA